MPPAQLNWYDNSPVVTITYLIGLLAINGAVLLKIVDEYCLYYDPILVFSRGQFWRPITAMLYYGPRRDFNILVKLSLTVFSYRLEEGWYSVQQKTADFAWLYIFSSISLLISATIFHIPFLAMELHLTIVLVWAFRALGQMWGNEGQLAVLMMAMLMGYRAIELSVWGCLTALVTGWLYWFLEDIFPNWPMSGGIRILKTPTFL
ncbi:hypothetical protein FBU30_003971 [Linnemannia zychae]|nr:hypothetical protein FBU30_003971 [Linnemannia zychae]